MKILPATFVSLMLAQLAVAQVAPTCDVKGEADKYQLLKRLSLDLRGKVPSYEEYLQLETPGANPLQLANAWYATDDFRLTMRRYHEALFWPNVSAVRIQSNDMNLNENTTSIFRVGNLGRRLRWRGDALGDCNNVLQSNFVASKPGEFRPVVTAGAGGVRIEGYRMVRPYWDPSIEVKACAFDAQETAVADDGTACDSSLALSKPECGCGPGLRWCMGPDSTGRIYASLREQLNLMVDDVTVGDKPYTDLLLSRRIPTNGTLSFWRKNMANTISNVVLVAGADPLEAYKSPSPDFLDAAFVSVDRGTDLHSGVLTTPAYLVRFMTDRARANRFRQDFECASFEPPQELVSEPGCVETGTDLTKRCNCQYCHVTLEPLAAHWGQFAEAGTQLMSDLTKFPRLKSSCVGSSNSTCRRFYVTNPTADNPGALLPYQYASRPDGTAEALAKGPRARATVIINNGVFAKCTTKKMFTYLMKREPALSESIDLDTIASGFKTNGYSLKWLMQQLVSRSDYRSVR
jgi:hypothetical protein